MEKKQMYAVMYSIEFDYFQSASYNYGAYETELAALRAVPKIIRELSKYHYEAKRLRKEIEGLNGTKRILEDELADEETLKNVYDKISDIDKKLIKLVELEHFEAHKDKVWVEPIDFYFNTITNP